MRDDQRKLDKTRARSYRAGPRYLSGEDASVALASNHQGHATGQRNNASASGDRSDGAGVGQRRVRSGGSTGRSVHVADAATSGDGAGPLPVEIWPRVVTPVVPTGPEAAPAPP